MKRITATFILLSALSAPAMAETPTERQMHSWDYVQQVSNPTQVEAPVMERHENRPYYHHEAPARKGKHHHEHMGKKHHAHGTKKHDGKMKHHRHHHHKDAMKKDTTTTTTTTTTAPSSDQK